MKKSKITEVLELFSSAEIDRLALFLQSPYLTTGTRMPQKTIELYHKLVSLLPFEEAGLNKELLHEELFPEQTYNAGRIDKLVSGLFKLIESFLQLEESSILKNSIDQQLQLSRYYQRKGLDRLQKNAVNNLEKHLHKIKQKSLEVLYAQFLLQNRITELKSFYNPRDEDLNLNNTIKALDNYYLTARLDLTNSLLAQKNFHNTLDTEDALDLVPAILEYAKKNQDHQSPLIACYMLVHDIMQMSDGDIASSQASIAKLEDILVQYSEYLPPIKSKELHSFNRSFFMRLINLGKKEVIPKAFTMYKDHYASGILLQKKGIHAANFKNMVWLGLKSKDFSWVFEFIEECKHKIIGTNFPEEVYKYNLARYYFATGEIEKADQSLSYQFKDLFYMLAVKRLEIMILLNKDEDLLEYKLNAFKIFVHRISKKQLPDIFKLGNNNFINFLKQILSPTNNDKSKREKIKQKIISTDTVLEKDWLITILSK